MSQEYLQKTRPSHTYTHRHTRIHTPRVNAPTPVQTGAVFLTFGWTPCLQKFQRHLSSQTQWYGLFLCAVPGSVLCLLSEGMFPLPVGFATCLWNIFFSYLRDKWDLHFPLNTNWLCLFFFFFFSRISDIWSNLNLFSYVTFSNNWALALAELVSIISERGKVHISTLCCRWTGGDGTVLLESFLTVFGRTQKLLYGGFWVDSLKGWFFFLVMISPLSGLPLCSIFI